MSRAPDVPIVIHRDRCVAYTEIECWQCGRLIAKRGHFYAVVFRLSNKPPKELMTHICEACNRNLDAGALIRHCAGEYRDAKRFNPGRLSSKQAAAARAGRVPKRCVR